LRKSVVWIGVGIILVGLVVYITASYLADIAAGKYITGWEQDDPDLVLQYFVDERTADRIGTVGSVLLFLGIALAFAGIVLEMPPPPATTYRDPGPLYEPQQRQYDPVQPPQQYPPEQPPPYPPQP
jgi:uncharacterized membrane protein